MTRPFRIFTTIAALAILAFAAFSLYVFFTGGSGEPTRQVEAERLEPVEPHSVVFGVVAGQSEARFVIDEILRGTDTTVTGITDQVDGSVAIGFEPPGVEIGPFEINLRSIATDDEMRDRTIRAMILQTNLDEYEFSTFRPTAVRGVPDSITPGMTLSLEVTGDLTIRNVTRSVEFDLKLEIISEEELRGTGSTVIAYGDFDIEVPYVGGNSIVAWVADEVRLELDFLARP